MVDKAKLKESIEKEFGSIEKIEMVRGETDPKQLVEHEPAYPEPLRRRFLVFESFGASIEENYFWVKDILGEMGYVQVDKITDTFTASEQSAFFGSAVQRLNIQQEKASQYLGTIGQMVKQMFQIVRDIRLLEEREVLYDKANAGDAGAEKSLKGAWVDFVDNGPQGVKASSVYGLASQLGYQALPSIFFEAPARLKQDEVTSYIESLSYNKQVKLVAVKKLHQYVTWRDSTWKEIVAKRKFTIQYLRQHYNSIKLYMDWIKPFLKNIKRLGMYSDVQLSSDIVGAFEGSVVEVEFLAKKPGNPHQCILVTFKFRTRPIMQTGADYQRGPMHIGRMEMTIRGYAWSDDDIQEFKDMKTQEDFEMLKSIDSSIEQAMDYLGDELVGYLKAAGEEFGKADERQQLAKALLKSKAVKTMEEAKERAKLILEGITKKPGILDPFKEIFTGFKELGKGFIPTKNEIKEKKKELEEIKEKKKEMSSKVIRDVGLIFLLYKKAHKLFTP